MQRYYLTARSESWLGADTQRLGTDSSDPLTESVDKGGPTPGYPKMLNRSNLTSGLVGRRFTTQPAIVSYENRYESARNPSIWYHRTIFGDHPYFPLADMSLHRGLLEAGNTELLARIYDIQSGAGSGVALGEVKETLQLIRNPLRGFRSAIDQLKTIKSRLRKKGLKRTSRAFLDAWEDQYLEWTFGAQPLVSDVANHAEHLAKLVRKVSYEVASISLEDNYQRDRIDQNTGLSGFPGRKSNWTEVSASVRGKAKVQVRVVTNATDYLHPSHWGLRLADVVPTAYELIPLSFVVDYFTNANSLLKSQFASMHGVVWTWLTQKRSTVQWYDVQLSSFTGGAGYVNTLFNGHTQLGFQKAEQVERIRVGGVPVAYRYTGSPSAKQTFNLAVLTDTLRSINR